MKAALNRMQLNANGEEWFREIFIAGNVSPQIKVTIRSISSAL